jgi:hypothetical protein
MRVCAKSRGVLRTFVGTSPMLANVMAHRHLEDARMRLGKAVQAFDGCKSVYDK